VGCDWMSAGVVDFHSGRAGGVVVGFEVRAARASGLQRRVRRPWSGTMLAAVAVQVCDEVQGEVRGRRVARRGCSSSRGTA
jgi:hypothetical protein